uniref:Peptidase M3A/M3B catalytic domain-containing protein n=1 Tax=Brassica oleracea var. oleracea TaxID=109376 RepID=A0A0D2ZU89_BRAOL
MDGLPPRALGLFPQAAVFKGHENATTENGPWVITLDAPSYFLVQHAKNRALREELYRAYLSRASSGDLDNTAIIDQILKLRLEKAKLLGYNNCAEVDMTMKMTIVEKAAELLEKLRSASWDPTVQDMEDLKNSAKSQCVEESDSLTHWDTIFWIVILICRFWSIKEELYPYFSLPKVMDGLFSLAKTLFGVDIEPTDGVAPFVEFQDSMGKDWRKNDFLKLAQFYGQIKEVIELKAWDILSEIRIRSEIRSGSAPKIGYPGCSDPNPDSKILDPSKPDPGPSKPDPDPDPYF